MRGGAGGTITGGHDCGVVGCGFEDLDRVGLVASQLHGFGLDAPWLVPDSSYVVWNAPTVLLKMALKPMCNSDPATKTGLLAVDLREMIVVGREPTWLAAPGKGAYRSQAARPVSAATRPREAKNKKIRITVVHVLRKISFLRKMEGTGAHRAVR